jgi:hypothetical protein
MCVPSYDHLQVGTLTELQTVNAALSREQQRDFRMPSFALTGGLIASIAFGLVASIFILIAQLRMESARMEREKRWAKARRLRNKANGAEVTIPHIPRGVPMFFHIFLSHTWGYDRTFLSLRVHAITVPIACILALQDGSGPNAHCQAAPQGDDAHV